MPELSPPFFDPKPKQFVSVLFFSVPYAEVKESTASPDDRVLHADIKNQGLHVSGQSHS